MWIQSIKYLGRDYLFHFKEADSQDKFNKSDLSSPLIHGKWLSWTLRSLVRI